jgi:hypothetical protein
VILHFPFASYKGDSHADPVTNADPTDRFLHLHGTPSESGCHAAAGARARACMQQSGGPGFFHSFSATRQPSCHRNSQ